jgi:hypothetical protein
MTTGTQYCVPLLCRPRTQIRLFSKVKWGRSIVSPSGGMVIVIGSFYPKGHYHGRRNLEAL